MPDLRSRSFRTWSLALLVLASAAAASAATRFQPQASAEATATMPPHSGPTVAAFDGAARTDDGRIQLFVELQQPSAAVVFATAMKGGVKSDKRRVQAAGVASQRAAGLARAEQAKIAPALRGLGAREMYRVARAINGIAVAVAPERVPALLKLPGIKRVLPIYPQYPTGKTSVPFLGTPNVWENTLGLPAGADGTGIRIGIIDTGIDYIHADFSGTGLLAQYQNEQSATSNFTTAIGTGSNDSFPTVKVVGGTDFAGDAYTGSNAPAPDANPMDCNGHGSHVSGTAAGLGVDSSGNTYTGPWDTSANYSALRIVPGTAPKALLYGLRVFGCGGSTGLTVQAIDWAMDPNNDDDVSDHLDVINMSLGSNFGTAVDGSSVASDNAAIAGVIVVTSAGNAGDTFFIAGAPGVATHAIATAASVDDGESAESVQVNSPAGVAGSYLGGTASFGTTPSGETADMVIAVDPTTTTPSCGTDANDACCALTNAAAMAGNICVVNRGTCTFKTKALNCQNAGAIGTIVVNNAPGSPPPGMADDATIVTPITIPTEMVTVVDGATIKNAINSTPPVNGTLLGQNGGDTLASFSSRGPRRIYGSPLQLKPDIAAPGLNITSVQTGHTCTGAGQGCTGATDPSGFIGGSNALVISGTSMASPHMAGVMALLRELHPDWSVDELKALAMNYAMHDTTLFPNQTPPRFAPSRIGGGRVDPSKAALGEVIAMVDDTSGVTSVVFDPEVVVTGPLTQTKTVRVINKGAGSQTYDLAFDNVVDSPGVAFSVVGPTSITVPAGGSVTVDVLMTANPALMQHTHDASLFATQGVQANYGDQPRNFLTEEASYLTFSQSSDVKLRLPVYMAERPASIMAGGPIVTGGNATGSTTIPLSGTGLCTGTLAAGPTCNGTFPTDVESLVSPFELQVVSPLDPLSSTDYADIHYVGTAHLQTGGSPSLTADLVMFGLASWGDWSTPSDVAYNVCVDNNNDGVYDRAVINSNPAIFVSGASFNDDFERVVQNLTTGGFSILGLGSPVNVAGPGVIDSAEHLNNVMVLAATPSLLGYASTAVTTMRYKVVTCPGFNPSCARSLTGDHCTPAPGTAYDVAAGPYFWDWANQGLNFGGDFLDEDLNGSALSVTWNTANMTANGSAGALLLHHQNGRGNRAQVVLLDTAQSADLVITKGISGTQTVDSNVTLTITVTNNGPDSVTGVVASEPLPASLAYVSDDGGGAYSSVSGLWTIGALASSSSATLHITARIAASGTSCSTAVITASTPLDTNASNNQATACVTAPTSADLQLGVVQPAGPVTAGAPLTFAYTLTNGGVDDAQGQVTVVSSVALTASGVNNPSAGTYTPGINNLWTVGDVPTGNHESLSLSGTAPNCACYIDVDAAAASNPTVGDPNRTNNATTDHLKVLSPATIDVYTMTAAGQLIPGGSVTYTVTLHNSGPSDQQDEAGDEFSLTLPSKLTLATASGSAGTIATSANTVTWNGALASGDTLTITITATIASGVLPGTMITAQGVFNEDGDGDFETPPTAVLTDDPALVGAHNPTTFVVASTGIFFNSFEDGDAPWDFFEP